MRWVAVIGWLCGGQALAADDTFQLFDTDCVHDTDTNVKDTDSRPNCSDGDTDVATVDTSRFVSGDLASEVVGEQGGPACASTGSGAWPGAMGVLLLVGAVRRQLGRI